MFLWFCCHQQIKGPGGRNGGAGNIIKKPKQKLRVEEVRNRRVGKPDPQAAKTEKGKKKITKTPKTKKRQEKWFPQGKKEKSKVS